MGLHRKNSINLAPLKDGWAYCMRKIFLSFAPNPQNPLPIRCGPPWAVLCGCGQARGLTRPSRSVHLDGAGTARAGLLPAIFDGAVVEKPPTATKKERTHLRVI
jgi:hypothetical protein